MIIVDRALQARAEAGNPVRAAMVGAGFMGRGIANQVVNSTPGMDLVAIANRNVEKARDAYVQAGVDAADIEVVTSAGELQVAIEKGRPAVTDDPSVLAAAGLVDAIVEVTGAIDHGAQVVLDAIDNGTHVILMNAELDGTVGPILKAKADSAGVIVTASDGDQPGVEMNLYRFVRGIGLTPLLCGNIKGLQDPYRNPTTQEGFAKRWGQNPWMVTSFADGTKISFEQAIVANATGMRVAQRGMLGLEFDGHVDELTTRYDVDHLRSHGGIVDYVVGTKPGPGCSCSPPTTTRAAPLPEPLQAGRGTALQLLHAVPPVPLRGPGLGRPSGALRRRGDDPARRPRGRRGDDGQGRPGRRRGDRRHGRLPHLRAGRERRRHPGRAPAADGPGRGVPAAPGRGQGRGAHL
jgi:predicted homoserine dehydrogenase-like protein